MGSFHHTQRAGQAHGVVVRPLALGIVGIGQMIKMPPQLLAAVKYADAGYWNDRYRREKLSFEWFFGYTALKLLLKSCITKKKPCLQVGCGTSNLQEGMAAAGYTVVNVSVSATFASLERPACVGSFIGISRLHWFAGTSDAGFSSAVALCSTMAHSASRASLHENTDMLTSMMHPNPCHPVHTCTCFYAICKLACC